jgi:hypothetical protein
MKFTNSEINDRMESREYLLLMVGLIVSGAK